MIEKNKEIDCRLRKEAGVKIRNLLGYIYMK